MLTMAGNGRLDRQLRAVEEKAATLMIALTDSNMPFAEGFPKSRISVLTSALVKIRRAPDDAIEDVLKLGFGRTRAIRRDFIPFEEEEEDKPEDKKSLHTRESGIDIPLSALIQEISTALDFYERHRPLDRSGTPEHEVALEKEDKTNRDQAIKKSQQLSNNFNITHMEAEALLSLHSSQHAKDLIAALYGVEIFNRLGRAELMGDAVPSWLERANQRIGGLSGVMAAARDGLEMGADLTDVVAKFLKDNIRPYTNAARGVAKAFDSQIKRMKEREREIKGVETSLSPAFDLDEIRANLIQGIRPHPAHIPNIIEIYFEKEVELTSLDAFDNLISLKTLSLWDTPVRSVIGLSRLTALHHIDLTGTNVSDIDALSELTELKFLSFSRTSVRDVAALANLTALEKLYLNETRVRDVSALSDLAELKVLDLELTSVADVSALSKLSALQRLDLRHTSVSDVSALSRLTAMKYLLLDGTKVSDVSPLSNLSNLEFLGLADTQVTDVSALACLTKLQELYLDKTFVSDFSALDHLVANGLQIRWGYD